MLFALLLLLGFLWFGAIVREHDERRARAFAVLLVLCFLLGLFVI